jgi:hypothetical protein
MAGPVSRAFQYAPVTGGSPTWPRLQAGIPRGLKSENAGVEASVSSPDAYRWVRHAGGVNPRLPPTVTGSDLSFSEREDIAIWHAQKIGVRPVLASPFTLKHFNHAALRHADAETIASTRRPSSNPERPGASHDQSARQILPFRAKRSDKVPFDLYSSTDRSGSLLNGADG